MLIAVNLLPGAHQRSAATPRLDWRRAFPSVATLLGDPILAGSVAATTLAVAVTGWLFTAQSTRTADVARHLEEAVADSARLSAAIAAQRRVTAERDSVERTLAVIRGIDDTRYQWAHLLDEVSRALPTFSWLLAVEQTSKPPRAPEADSAPPPARARSTAARARKLDPPAAPAPEPLTFRVVGQTLDIQALTLFMRQLESSPFVARVTLVRSEVVALDGKEVTQFELAAAYEAPPPGVVQVAPLVVPVR
ncbi:MAG: PilN domain-containing protein [Gemmatimonadetes bacterium]|nr:PilN domain-containing protein [Gemmatimonadota bacterium]